MKISWHNQPLKASYMGQSKKYVGRTGAIFGLVALLSWLLSPMLTGKADAVGVLSPRKLTMSSQSLGTISIDANGTAVVAGAGGNGAKAKHTFNFTFATSAPTIGSVLLEYCTTPVLSTACTAPTGMDASTVATAPTVSGFGGTAPALDTTTTANSGGIFATSPCSGSGTFRTNCILLKRASGFTETGTPAITLSFGQGAGTDWIKNPTVVGTFYVRIMAFSDIAYTTIVDQGAVAADVVTNIDITSKVQEKLNFSVAATTVAPTAACTPLSGSGALVLGDPTNGVLDPTIAYDAHSYFRLNTNATGGTNVYYSGDTLKTAGGANSITALTTSPTVSSPGTSQFGLALDTSDTLAGSGYSFTNLARTSPYDSGAGAINGTFVAQFAYDTTSVSTPKQIAGVVGSSVACDTGSLRYLGNVSTVTKSGIYKTTIAYIAVPTF